MKHSGMRETSGRNRDKCEGRSVTEGGAFGNSEDLEKDPWDLRLRFINLNNDFYNDLLIKHKLLFDNNGYLLVACKLWLSKSISLLKQFFKNGLHRVGPFAYLLGRTFRRFQCGGMDSHSTHGGGSEQKPHQILENSAPSSLYQSCRYSRKISGEKVGWFMRRKWKSWSKYQKYTTKIQLITQ